MTTLSPLQCQCARVLLKWSQKDLAERCNMNSQTICMFETEKSTPTKRTLETITTVFENAGIEFLDGDGVKKITGEISLLKGQDGMRQFFNELYHHALHIGGDICLFNGMPSKLSEWLGDQWYEEHTQRMTSIKERYDYKIIVREGETNMPAREYATYRYFPEKLFNRRTIYLFGGCVYFRTRDQKKLHLIKIQQPELASSIKVLFDIAWSQVATKVKEKESA